MDKTFDYPYEGMEDRWWQKEHKEKLLSDGTQRVNKKIAVLCGSKADMVCETMELFLLHSGIMPELAVYPLALDSGNAYILPEELKSFEPDIVYVFTTYCNIIDLLDVTDSEKTAEKKFDTQYARFEALWTLLGETVSCPVIQNNFEPPVYRLMGNCECWDRRGRINFVNRLNLKFAEYAEKHENFYISDINYVSATFGIDTWHDPAKWYTEGVATSDKAAVRLAANTCAIIKAISGMSKQVLALDLNNVLWGGTVEDDGAESIRIGQDVPGGFVYSDFQRFVRMHKDIGVALAVCAKNDIGNVMAGLEHPDGILRPSDFADIRSEWTNKDEIIKKISEDLSVPADRIVYADEDPEERRSVVNRVPGVEAPAMDGAVNYLRTIDRNRYFEVARLTDELMHRADKYKENAAKAMGTENIADYGEYLESLEMKASIKPFEPMYIGSIAKLINKSNRFNLTARRYSEGEIANLSHDPGYITLFGILSDKFGDNGVISAIIGQIDGDALKVDLWVMSGRVLKRDMEFAMADKLVEVCKEKGIKKLVGKYCPTTKNSMVKEFYQTAGFKKTSADQDGNTHWEMNVSGYKSKNVHISIK